MVAETTPSPQAIPALSCALPAADRHMLPICVTLDIAERSALSSLLDSLGEQAVNSNAREALPESLFSSGLIFAEFVHVPQRHSSCLLSRSMLSSVRHRGSLSEFERER